MALLTINNLHVSIDGKPILRGVHLTIRSGEIHALMGPNGSGKSTLAATLMGHPFYKITGGSIEIDGQNVTETTPEERAQKGLFLAFQYPMSVPGVPILAFLRAAHHHLHPETVLSLPKFKLWVSDMAARLDISVSFLDRPVNEGFSGGEKKKLETLQMSILKPKIAVMDETDSGLDVDALRSVAAGVNTLAGPDLGILLITHYQRILQYIKPHFVHVMKEGQIVESGGADLAERLEKEGYQKISNT